jgi:geranylgeranyl pyrophosphate synthase
MNTKLKTPLQLLYPKVEDRMRAQFSGNPSFLVTTIDQFLLLEDNRIRPNIIFLIGGIFDAEEEILLELAAAVEMMHTATRVHDDLSDDAKRSRNQKSINSRFTTSATVLAGDFAFAAASQLAAATKRIIVMQKFSETLQFIVNGEITNMFNNGDRRDPQAYYDWIHAKTASMFELASGMAATLGTANPIEIESAYKFGYNVGMAFQITDDILDFMGDSSYSEDHTGNDLRQGIITLPTLLYLESLQYDLDISAILKNNGNGHGNIEDIITTIRQSEFIDQAAAEADRFINEGLEHLASLPDTPERAELELLVRDITQLKEKG